MSHISQPAQVASAPGANGGASHPPSAAIQPKTKKLTNRSFTGRPSFFEIVLAPLSPEAEVGCFSADAQDEGEQVAIATKQEKKPWEFGKEWSHTLSHQKKTCNYADYAYDSTQPTPSVRSQIDTLLRLPPEGVHATMRPSHDSKILLILDCSRQRWVRRRKPLRRCLLYMSAWNKRLGCNHDYAMVCAVLNCCVEDSCKTFEGAVALFNQYSLGDYFGHLPDSRQQSCMTKARDCTMTTVSHHCFGDRLSHVRRANGISKDVELVWQELVDMWPSQLCFGDRLSHVRRANDISKDVELVWQELVDVWPSIAQVFMEHCTFQLFSDLIEAWLLTLFVESFDPQSQSITDFLPLFQRVVTPVATGIGDIDPRRNLRYIAVSILAAQHHAFMSIASRDALQHLVSRLQYRLVVDATLLNFIDNGVTPRHVEARHVGALLPLGCAAGWLGGMLGMGLLGSVTGAALAAAVGVVAAQRHASSEHEDSNRMSSPEAFQLEDTDELRPSETSGAASSSTDSYPPAGSGECSSSNQLFC